jgi:ketosteroid isomerase-like protein
VGTQRTIDEIDIRRRIEAGVAAVRAMDLEGVMALYAPDTVSFDIGSPLRSGGAEAKRRAWVEAFAMYQRPLGYEVRDLTIAVGDDLAFGHSVNRISAVLKNGGTTGFWLRWTTCFGKIGGNWLIVHDHVSVPVDPKTRTALLDLGP